MREPGSRWSTPALAYAAAGLFLVYAALEGVFRPFLPKILAHLAFLGVVAILARRVDAPPWGRACAYAWVGIGLLADVLNVAFVATQTDVNVAYAIRSAALLPGAAWMYAASMSEEGAGHALGAAAAAGLAFSGVLGVANMLLLEGPWALGEIVQRVALILAIVWFAILAKDLAAGKRHWGGPIKVFA